MNKPVFTLIVSILFGIALPLVSGVKDFRLIALLFTFAWLIYAVGLLIKHTKGSALSTGQSPSVNIPRSHP